MPQPTRILLLAVQFVFFVGCIADGSSYWLANIQRQGVNPFNTDPNYPVFRNVKQSYGGVPGAVGKQHNYSLVWDSC
jgi:hypothetical protein